MMLVKIIIFSVFMIIGFSQPVFAENGTLTIIKTSNSDIPIIFNVTNFSTFEYSKLHSIEVVNGRGMTCPMVLPSGDYSIVEWFGLGVSLRDVNCNVPIDWVVDASDIMVPVNSGTNVICTFDNLVNSTTYDPTFLDPFTSMVEEPQCVDSTGFANFTVVKNSIGGDSSFSIQIDAQPSIIFNGTTVNGVASFGPIPLPAGGPHNVTETDIQSGFSFTNVTCTKDFGIDESNQRIGLTVEEGDSSITCTFENTSNTTFSDIPIIISGLDNSTTYFDNDGNTIINGTDASGTTLLEITFPPETTSPSGTIDIIYDDSGENAFVEVTGAFVPDPQGKTIKINVNPGDSRICIIDSSSIAFVSGLPDCGATDLEESRVIMDCDGISHTYEEEPPGHRFPDIPSARTYTCTRSLGEGGQNFMEVTGLAYSFIMPITDQEFPNLGQKVSDFVHESVTLFKQQKIETKNQIKQCRENLRDSPPDDIQKAREDCRESLDEIRSTYKETRLLYQETFKEFRDSIKVFIKDAKGFDVKESEKQKALNKISEQTKKKSKDKLEELSKKLGKQLGKK